MTLILNNWSSFVGEGVRGIMGAFGFSGAPFHTSTDLCDSGLFGTVCSSVELGSGGNLESSSDDMVGPANPISFFPSSWRGGKAAAESGRT